MSKNREFIDYINDIIDSIEKIQEFTKDFDYFKFSSDDKTSYAVIRCFEIIGEATKNIPNDIKLQFNSIPWQEMAAIRDKLIHGYFGINLEVIWKTIQEDIDSLIPLLTDMKEKIEK